MAKKDISNVKNVLVIISNIPRSKILKNTILGIDKNLVVDVVNTNCNNLDISLKMLENHMDDFLDKYSYIFIDSYFVSIENDRLNNLYKKVKGYNDKSIMEKTELNILHSYSHSISDDHLFESKDIIQKTKFLQKGIYKNDAYKKFFDKLMSFNDKICNDAKFIFNSLAREANEISCIELEKYGRNYNIVTFLGNKTSDSLNKDLISKDILDSNVV